MEEHRCKIVAAEAEDSRCTRLLNSVQIGMDDPRCESLHTRMVLLIEDRRANSVAIQIEDPRCAGLQTKW